MRRYTEPAHFTVYKIAQKCKVMDGLDDGRTTGGQKNRDPEYLSVYGGILSGLYPVGYR